MIDIRDHVAAGDGTTMNSVAIQRAINHCSNSGGGCVLVPPGKYLTGTLIMKNNVELHLAHYATLLGSTSPEDYPLQPVSKYPSRYNLR